MNIIYEDYKKSKMSQIFLGRGCMNSKNKAFTIRWAQCISDTVSKMASTQAKMRLGKKLFVQLYLIMIVKCLQEVFWLSYTVKFITLLIFFYFYFSPTVFLYHAASIRVIILSLDNQKCSACSHALSTVIAHMYIIIRKG